MEQQVADRCFVPRGSAPPDEELLTDGAMADAYAFALWAGARCDVSSVLCSRSGVGVARAVGRSRVSASCRPSDDRARLAEIYWIPYGFNLAEFGGESAFVRQQIRAVSERCDWRE